MIRFFADRHLLVNLISVAAISLAFALSPQVPREYLPAVNMPRLTITATLPGASAQDMQTEITIPIEEAITEIDGIDKFYSVISDSVSSTSIELYIDSTETQVQTAMQDLRDAIAAITDFPETMTDAPILTRLNPGKRPIIEIALAGPMQDLVPVAETLEKQIERLNDISSVAIIGLQEPEARVLVDPIRAKGYGIPITDVISAIERRNVSGTGGTLKSDKSRMQIVLWGRYNDPKEILDTIIPTSNNENTIRVREIAQVELTRENTNLLTYTNGQQGLSLIVRKREDADAIKAVDDVKSLLAQTNIPSSVSYSLVNDDTFFTRNRLQVMLSNGIMGVILVSGILLLFMRFDAAAWVLLGIPIVFCSALIWLLPLGLTFNLFTLTGFVIVLGMVVDDAIVVTENIVAHTERGLDSASAAILGAQEMVKPVIASALTTALAFGPIVAMGGIPGKVLWQIPAIVVLVLIFSLLETFFILPSHLSSLRSNKPTLKRRWIQRLEILYRRALRYCLHKRLLVIAVAFSTFAAIMMGVRPLVEFEQFPQTDARTLFLRLSAPIGTPIEQTAAIAQTLQAQITKLTQVDLRATTTRIGHQDSNRTDKNRGEAEHEAVITIFLKDLERNKTNKQWIDQLEQDLILPQGSTFTLQSEYVGPPTDQPVTVHVLSANDSVRRAIAREIADYIGKLEGTTQIQIDERPGTAKLRLNIDHQKLDSIGLDVQSVARAVQAIFFGVEASEIRSTQEITSVRVQFRPDAQGNLNALLDTPIRNRTGQLVSLRDAIKPVSVPGIDRIYHREGSQAATVRASFSSGSKHTAITFANQLERDFLYRYQNHPEAEVIIGGEAADTLDATKNLASVAFFVLIGIIITIWLTLGSLLNALAAIIAIPFAIAGVIVAFFLHGMPLSMTALIGTIGLAGVVANASIVMMDSIHRLRISESSGRPLAAIVEDAVVSRLRPILITTLTTLGGVLPTAYGLGGYDSIVSPMSIAIGWGLAFSTLVTLFLVPVLFTSLNTVHQSFYQAWRNQVQRYTR